LDEINLATDELLEFLYSYLISIFYEDENNKNYISPDGVKYERIGNIGVIATMNDAKLSSSRTSLSHSFLNLCHSFKLPNYTLHEIELLAEKIIRKNINKLFNKYEFMKVIKCYNISQKYSTKYSENGGNAFREILILGQFIDKCGEIPLEYLLELIFCTNIPTSELENFRRESGLNVISNSLNDLKLKIENKHLCFDNFVKYELINTKNYEIKTQFTIPQKEAIMKMMIGLLAERPILLTGEIGTGKTFIFEQLANIIGAKLSVIQFNSETTSLDIIGRLELIIDKKN
jgi:midasin (ATPase involved in ribosome maturation)